MAPEGQLVRRIYVEEGADIAELYLGVVLDRDAREFVYGEHRGAELRLKKVAEQRQKRSSKSGSTRSPV